MSKEIHYPCRLYRNLEEGEQTVIFGDPAETADYCAATVFSKKRFDFPIVMNEVMESSQFGYELFYLAKYIHEITQIWPKLAIERNTGQATITVLRLLNYPNLFRMIDFSATDPHEGGGIGWVTTGFSRNGEIQGTRRKMLDDFAMVLRQKQITIYDEEQIRQLMGFVIVKGRGQQTSNMKDDLVIACYSDDTEVLTNTGWKRIIDVKKGEKIPSMDIMTKEVSLATNISTYINSYQGDMIHFNGRGIDIITTPNHKMVVAKSGGHNEYYSFSLERADSLINKHFRLLNHAIWGGNKKEKWIIPGYKPSKFHPYKNEVIFNTNDFLSLLGFYIAEGCVVGDDKNGYRVCFAQVEKSKGFLPFKQLLEKMNIKYTYIPNKQFNVYNTQLARYLARLIPKYAHNKRIPREILELHPKHLIHLYEYMMLGDGCNDRIYVTNSEGLKNDFCELVSKLGWYSTLGVVDSVGKNISCNPKYKIKHKCYFISIGKTHIEPRFNHHDKNQVNKILYEGNIVCLTLDKNHIMLVRRNGTTCWSGNTTGAYQIHLITPNEGLDEFDEVAFKAKKEKWRFK